MGAGGAERLAGVSHRGKAGRDAQQVSARNPPPRRCAAAYRRLQVPRRLLPPAGARRAPHSLALPPPSVFAAETGRPGGGGQLSPSHQIPRIPTPGASLAPRPARTGPVSA